MSVSMLSSGQFGSTGHKGFGGSGALELGDDYSVGGVNQMGSARPVHQGDFDVAPLMASTFGTVANTTMWRQRRNKDSRVLAYTGANAGSVFKFPGAT